MAFSPLQVWYPFTLPTELPTEGSMEPEQKDRETNRARQTCQEYIEALNLFFGTHFELRYQEVNTAQDNILMERDKSFQLPGNKVSLEVFQQLSSNDF